MSRGFSDYVADRDRELRRVFLSFFGGDADFITAVYLAAKQPASRFWCSVEKMTERIKKNDPPQRQRAMYDEIRRRCNGDYSTENIERVIYSPAPSFYITPLTARKIIYRTFAKR
jgi:hypothetical protein